MSNDVFIGVDIATSNMRAVAIDQSGVIQARSTIELAPVMNKVDKSATQDCKSWITGIEELLIKLSLEIREKKLIPQSLLISATSGTFVITDKDQNPISAAVMYNDGRAADPIARAELVIKAAGQAGPYFFANTPEFVIAHLSGLSLAEIATDTSHSLKMGVDLSTQEYLGLTNSKADQLHLTLPKLVLPGVEIAKISIQMATRLALPSLPIYAGMTDGCTAQIAAGGATGSVTSLGTTMVIKVVADKEISGDGFYSHHLPQNRYLVGGASNIGGISYQQFSTNIESYNQKAADLGVANIVTYPLTTVGERFPIKSASMKYLTSAKAESDVMEFRAILESIAFTEKYAYDLLDKAGAVISPIIYTTGGGGRSKLLSKIRATVLNKKIAIANTTGSDMGAALLSLASATKSGIDLTEQLAKVKISQSHIYEPDQAESAQLNDNYQKYLSLIAPYL
jgi:sugar (pentulose or hexulose) kinase